MKYSRCPLNSKMIPDVWRLTKEKSKHRLMETNLSEKPINKDVFSCMTVYLAVQFLSSSVVTMIRKETNDSSTLPNLRLKQNQYDKIIEMAEKVDKLVHICNGRSKEKVTYTANFTPEDSHKNILDWFTKWNDTVKRLGNDKDNFLPVQSWNSLQSLILGLVGLIEVKVIKDGQKIFPKTTKIDGIEKKIYLFKTKHWK